LDCKDIFRFFALQIYFKINFSCRTKPDLLVWLGNQMLGNQP